MRTIVPSLIEALKLPKPTPAVRARMVERLYGMEPGVFLSSTLAATVIGVVLYDRTGDAVFLFTSMLVVASVVVLLAVTRHFTRHVRPIEPGQARQWAITFGLFSLLIAGGVGLMTSYAFLAGKDALTLLIVETLCLGTVCSITRNYFSLPTMLLQLVVLLVVPAICMLQLGGVAYLVIALGSVALFVNMVQVSFGLHREMVLSLVKDETLETQHHRFDAALANMAQGLCMFDAEERLVVFNQRYLEMHGFSASVVRPGMSLEDLLRHSIEIGNHGVVDDLQASYLRLRAQMFDREEGTFSHLLEDGRTIEVSHQKVEGGGWVATHEDITERKRRDEKIAYMARHDDLTGLGNRATFREQLAAALERTGGSDIAVLAIDLDRFKPVNDTLGHPVGDAAMQILAKRLTACLEEDGFVARIGGDEFAVLRDCAGRPHCVAELAERIIAELSRPLNIKGHQIVLGASIGIAQAPQHGSSVDELLRHADLALYRAKDEGFGRYVSFSPDMDGRMRDRRAMELDLRRALREGEFSLAYQPFVELADGQIAGFEALLRWNRPGGGDVGPATFIPLAEEMGLISQLGEWVLREACQEAASWPDEIGIAINLSPAQFRHGNLPQLLLHALASSGLDPARLEIEITEGVLLQNEEAARTMLDQIRTIGAQVAMDDFGTGYSSLGYLRSFPFDKIKIDQAFVKDVPSGGDALAIAKAIVTLGNSLGRTVLAEGVENEAQYLALRQMGVMPDLIRHPEP
ncbi:MAG: EAL domain-containing protein [Sphingomonadales bacterium]|nr:EAL domain-containing protein [Sphingomonadales bacterium]